MAASSSIILPSGIGLVFNNDCDAEDVPDVKTLTEDQTMESFETLMTVENLPKPSNEKK